MILMPSIKTLKINKNRKRLEYGEDVFSTASL